MDAVTEAVRRIAVDTGFSGVVRVDEPGSTQLAAAFGFAHRGLEAPNELDTQFAIASGAKGFTALAMVSLIESGDISLTTRARSVLGDDLPLIDDAVTIEHLLAHTSGIGDYLDEEDETLGATDYVLDTPVHRLETTEGFLAEIDGYPMKFSPGARFSYSNGGYVVLAVILERAGGRAYHDLVAERILDPAQLSDTAFLRSDEPTGRMALGYLESSGLRTNVLHLPVRGNGDGGIYTTAGDMHRFWQALFNGRIVSEEWVTRMTSPVSTVPYEHARYGLGFWLAENGPAVMLIGGDAGVSFTSAHDPTTQSTWTVISNTTNGAWPLIRHLQSALW